MMIIEGNPKKKFLASIAFTTGAIVMALEITGSRVLTPIFGSSTTTWGILIGIILTGLATGYFFGGKFSDTKPSFEKLCSLVFSTGLFILFIPLISQDFIEFFIRVFPSSSIALFFSTLAIFGFPSVLLGFVSPYAIKLAAKTLSNIGSISGNLYSISTLGSIFGTFFTIFVLIPTFEVHPLIFSFGFTLLAIAILGLGKIPKILFCAILIIFLVNYSTLNIENSFGFDSETIFERETPYGSLTITEKDGFRTMYIDGAVNSSLELNDPTKLVLYYTTTFHLAGLINPDFEKVLFVGGGGFSGPKSFLHHYDQLEIEASEIDPLVIDVAKKYFSVPNDPRLSIINEDSRVHLAKTEKQYDVVILDAYRGYNIPFHLMTQEFYEIIDKKLSQDGFVIANFIGTIEGENSELFQSNYNTMKTIFSNVYVFPSNVNSVDYRQNITLVGLKGDSGYTIANLLKSPQSCNVPELECEKFFKNFYKGPFDVESRLLTDQFSPVNELDKFEETSFVYNEIKKSSNLSLNFSENLLIPISLILMLIIWIIYGQKIWKHQ